MSEIKRAKKPKKIRLDKFLVELDLVSNADEAARIVMAGKVLVDERPASKPSDQIKPGAKIRIKGKGHDYVGRGGLKLERALGEFAIPCDGICAMDIGASTGGFTDCLLRRGAKRIYAIDVGYGQMDPKLAKDGRVRVKDRTNILKMDCDEIEEEISLVVIDLSFISLTNVLPAVIKFLKRPAKIVALIKPQFELSSDEIGDGGIVTAEDARERAIERVKSSGIALGLNWRGTIPSPIDGAKGNKEFLICFEL